MARTALVVAMTVAILTGGLLWQPVPVAAGLTSSQTDITGPSGSGQFGASVLALPSGNIVVTDPSYDSGESTDAGAVYLYNGATGALISTLTGSNNNDQVGSGGVVALTNGNYVVRSPNWNNDGTADAGAVTWGHGTTGVSGVVSSANSLVGTTADDRVGAFGVTALTNGNYVVLSPAWDSGTVEDAGAATWGDGTTGVTGVVSAFNSLVGSTAGDQVGWIEDEGVTALTNGNYVVLSSAWDSGTVANAGAATWGDGTTGIAGVVTTTNSLVGGTANDQVGWFGAEALSNGNYVVLSPYWDGAVADAGAATWGDGTTGVSGVVSSANSLVGTTADDRVGYEQATALTNGNYVVLSSAWDNGTVANAGAATWGNGTTGVTGVVTTSNSLVGTTAGDEVGNYGVTALTNGNYVVLSPYWNGAVAGAGAATWGNGTAGTTGLVSASNSLVGSTGYDWVSRGGVTALVNGNYVVLSDLWHNGGTAQAGAATWGNGTTGLIGVVSASNSLVGSTAGDQVGYGGATPLANGHYVVRSPYWHNGAVERAGAATWGNGTAGTTGLVSASNSLVGTTAHDRVGLFRVEALSNGNYVVLSPYWNGAVAAAGAVTWGNGTTGVSGAVSVSNSLVGGTAGDWVGLNAAEALTNGHYVVLSRWWHNGGTADAGAATWGNGMLGLSGTITAENSVRGTAAGGGVSMVFDYDYTNDQLVVGRPAENIVTLFKPPCYGAFLPLVLKKAS